MLQTLREKTSGWIATVIIGLLIIPFALVGLQDYLVQRGDVHVAEIDVPPSWWRGAPAWWPVSTLWEHERITTQEFRTRLENARQRARQEQGEAFDARAFETAENKRAVLEQMIDERVQAIAARESGVAVDDALVRREIQSIPAFQVDGRFSPERYQLALASQSPPQTPRQFEQLVREGVLQTFLASNLNDSAFTTPSEIERMIRLLGERRSVTLMSLPPATPDAAPVSDAEIQKWYAANAKDYRAPQQVTLEYVELDGSTLPVTAVDDEALRRRYEQEKNRYVAAEQRLASHILVRVPEGADAAAVEAARKKAEALAAQARAPGADFAALARANTDDEGSKAGGGDLGWVTRGLMVGPFEDALFSMKSGEIAGPVRTDFGWHVIQLRDLQAGAQESFEQARSALAREQAESDRERAFNDLSGRLVDLVYKNPSSLVPAARELKLPVQTLGPVSRDESTGILANPAVKRAAFSEALIQDGTVSDPIEIGPNRSVLIRVTSHSPERTLPLAQVRERVEEAVRMDRTRKAAEARARALVKQVQGGASLASIAQANGAAEPTQIPELPRGAPLGAPGVSEAVFSAAAPAAGTVTPGTEVLPDGSVVLFTVDAVMPGDVATLDPTQRATLQQQLQALQGASDVQALVRALRQRYRIDVVETNF
ncbi:SurA N-terminal domain-containing protein [Cognatilysobacter bugurensis]|uniref:Periplasmic chaperone PpiD n=1 Tax=Cognatilysobacter bugurensis TaxID=543356 RepID=A0A918SUC0_9GAMM|nr:SurA N-terminal domain-containing protein [Lysobacter bugurensis]GHA69630.1 peptidylprolyl isomerase [Lysobacter bugurensis]